jgi:hypothetical protein
MRRIIASLAFGGLASASFVACDVEDPFNPSDTSVLQDTSTEQDTSTQEDTVQPATYFAVIVDDSEVFPTHRAENAICLTSASKAHGADIDGVGLFDAQGNLVGYYDSVRLEQGDYCEFDAKYTNPDEAKGEPDGTLTENFASLGGGYIIGEFDNAAQVLAGYAIQVYEVGAEVGGVDEGYDVFVATDLSCGQGGADRSSCQVAIGSGEGQGSFTGISGF